MRRVNFIIVILLSSLISQAQFYVANAGPDKVVCLGDSVQIGGNPIASGGMAPYNPTWTPNFNISNQNASNPKVAPNTDTWYYLEVTDANGRSAFDSVYVEVYSATPVTLSPIPSICFEDDPYFFIEGNPSGGIYKGNGVLDSLSIDPFYSGIGTHDITYIVFDSICQFTDSSTRSMEVNLNPMIQIIPDDTTICKGDTILARCLDANTYIWKPTTGIQVNVDGDSAFVSPDSTTSYKIIGSSVEGCFDSTTFLVKIKICTTGVELISNSISWKIFPNPTTNRIYISELETQDDTKFEIYNPEGRLRKNGAFQDFIEVSDLEEGTYILKILLEDQRVGEATFIKH